MAAEDIRGEVREFIRQNFIFDPNMAVNDGDSLLGSGVLDSTGVLELIGHLEGKYHVRFDDNELTAENFDSIERITAIVTRKRSNAGGN